MGALISLATRAQIAVVFVPWLATTIYLPPHPLTLVPEVGAAPDGGPGNAALGPAAAAAIEVTAAGPLRGATPDVDDAARRCRHGTVARPRWQQRPRGFFAGLGLVLCNPALLLIVAGAVQARAAGAARRALVRARLMLAGAHNYSGRDI